MRVDDGVSDSTNASVSCIRPSAAAGAAGSGSRRQRKSHHSGDSGAGLGARAHHADPECSSEECVWGADTVRGGHALAACTHIAVQSLYLGQ
jgi:hypothetical protein